MSKKLNVWLFFLLAIGWSWLFWIPAALVSQSGTASTALEKFLLGPYNLGGWGPFVSALLLTYLNDRWRGIKKLFKRGISYRFGAVWYLVIFLLFPVLVGGALLLALLTEEPTQEMVALSNPITIPVAFVYIFFLGGPLQEEFGWRGYALERLQESWNSLVSSIIVGLMWGVWHLPLFFMPRNEFYYQRPIWGLMLSTVLVSILFTWLYNNTGRSVLAALLFHTMFNLSHYLFPTLGSDRASQYFFILLFISVLAVLVIWWPKRMARERGESQSV